MSLLHKVTLKFLSGSNALPTAMTTGAVVPFGDTFLIVGGHDGSSSLDTIYYYEVDTESWSELDATLSSASSQLEATVVDINNFPSC